jgi:hypothetical protein
VVEQQPHDLGRLPAPRGHMQRRLLLLPATHVRVGAVVEQPAQAATHVLLARDVPVTQQEVERRVAPVAGQVEVDAVLEQQLERLHVVALGGVEGRLAVVRAGARLEQHPRDPRGVAVAGHRVQRRQVVRAAVARAGIGAGVEQRARRGLELVERRVAEPHQRTARWVAGSRLDLRAVGEVVSHRFVVAECRGHVQALGHEARILVVELQRPLGVAGGDSAEEGVDGHRRVIRAGQTNVNCCWVGRWGGRRSVRGRTCKTTLADHRGCTLFLV